MMVQFCNLNTQEADAGRSHIYGHPGLQGKMLSWKEKKYKSESGGPKQTAELCIWGREHTSNTIHTVVQQGNLRSQMWKVSWV